jgi:aerobic-type carbon monoxide dehydrogenase small subunit (CoxS/CutS family)
MSESFRFKLNGKSIQVDGDGSQLLLWFLRNGQSLTGTKYGCGEGFCGACTVLIDGEAVRSCTLPVSAVAGKEVITIEGLAENNGLHPIQSAFIEHDALQCGFCTPGMIMNAAAFLKKNPNPSDEEITENLEDNLCRCGAHTRIIQAIKTASKAIREEA